MLLKSLTLRNIRSYKHQKISFPKGNVLLSGDIGAGKTTILLAIEFALFGIMRSGLSGNALLRHGTESGEVELNFLIDQNDITIKRSLKRNRNSIMQDSGYLIKNGKKIEGTPIELKSLILAYLGYPKEMITRSKSLIYRYTVYTPQENMKQILTESADSRLETLRKVFGIDKYKNIRENAAIYSRELKKRKAGYEIRTEDLEEKQTQKKERQHELKELNILLDAKVPESEALKKQRKNTEAHIVELEKDLKTKTDLVHKINLKKTSIEEKKSQSKKHIENLHNTDETIKKLENKITEYDKVTIRIDPTPIEKEIERLNSAYHSIKEKKILLKQKIDSLAETIERTREDLKKYSKDSKDLMLNESRLSQLEFKEETKKNLIIEMEKTREKLTMLLVKSKEKNIQKLNSQDLIDKIKKMDSCPTCHQDVKKEHKENIITKESEIMKKTSESIDKISSIKKLLEQKLTALETKIHQEEKKEKEYITLKTKNDSLKKNSEKLIDLQKRLNQYTIEKEKMIISLRNIKNTEDLIKKIEENKQNLKKIFTNNEKFNEKSSAIKILEDKLSDKKRINTEIKKAIQEIKQHKEEITVIEEKIKSYKDIEKDIYKIKENLQMTKDKENTLQISIIKLKEGMKSLTLQIKSLDEEIQKKLTISKKVSNISALITWIEDFFIKLMGLMEKHIMFTIYNEFNSLLQKWFSMLVDQIDIKLDEEFSPIMYQNGHETEYNHLSGGEKTSVALAYRLALNKVINDLVSSLKTKGLIILDEPTDGFSNEQLDKVRDIFEEIDMDQAIIVSHEPKMESFVEKVIRIGKTEHSSNIIN